MPIISIVTILKDNMISDNSSSIYVSELQRKRTENGKVEINRKLSQPSTSLLSL